MFFLSISCRYLSANYHSPCKELDNGTESSHVFSPGTKSCSFMNKSVRKLSTSILSVPQNCCFNGKTKFETMRFWGTRLSNKPISISSFQTYSCCWVSPYWHLLPHPSWSLYSPKSNPKWILGGSGILRQARINEITLLSVKQTLNPRWLWDKNPPKTWM